MSYCSWNSESCFKDDLSHACKWILHCYQWIVSKENETLHILTLLEMKRKLSS